VNATADLARAYSRTGAAWQRGPGRVYDVLAERVLDAVGAEWSGALVADVGAGTGAASRAIARAGGRPVALDVAQGMLAALGARTPRAVADARRLPIAAARLDGYVAAFCLNHLTDPDVALVEARRVVRPGRPIVASAYAADDDHPVKAAVEAALAELGWTAPGWVQGMKEGAVPLLATVPSALQVAGRAALRATRAVPLEVPFPELDPVDLVAWRLGMAQVAPFVATLTRAQRDGLAERAVELLGEAPPLVRRVIVLTGTS
jgi:ubiquinone/menaquinone biosynthesis C-methylase UbiE